MKYAEAILPLALSGTYTYNLPDNFAGQVQVGCRIVVPFGQRRFYSALVVDIHERKPDYEVKEALELLDARPVLLPAQFKLWQWIADYYLCTIGEVYRASMPAGMKLESESSVTLCPDYTDFGKLTTSEQKILDVLAIKETMSLADLQKETSLQYILPHIRRLLDKGALLMKEELIRSYKPKCVTCVRLRTDYFDEAVLNKTLNGFKRAKNQEKLLLTYAELSALPAALALENPQLLKEVSRKELTDRAGCTTAVLNTLVQKGILEIYRKKVGRIPEGCIPGEMLLPTLSQEQQNALKQIQAQWQTHPTCLLHGVTGSGKTEIYIHLIHQAMKEGKQVLYLLPEIVLTAQLTQRLKRVFGNRLGVYHSRYPDAERVEVYQKMCSSEPYDIIVGVRSSIFLPYQNLGLIIVDEEHENSFKQQEPAPRYHARNAALVLAAQNHAHTLLGSATPSIESFHNAQSGKYGLVTLNTRYRGAQLPLIEVVDVKEQRRKKLMKGSCSAPLLEAIRKALDTHRQVILFQNRRGYAPMVECHECGWVPRCQHCDVSLTLHRSSYMLNCHYCGSAYAIPSQCPNCGSRNLSNKGYGTERIEDEVSAIFPNAHIARMDLDTTRSRNNYEQILQDFQQGKTDILIGTQMVTKGLDFERVSVVGILGAQGMLSQPDFRSYERAFQMMEQVAGRAGRHQTQGKVFLQTTDPDNPIVKQVIAHDYPSMYADQMAERELFRYPPYCRLIYVYIKHRKENVAEGLAKETALLLRRILGERVMGPDTPHISRIRQMYIRQILLKIGHDVPLQEVRTRLRQLQEYLLQQEAYKSAQFYYDVD